MILEPFSVAAPLLPLPFEKALVPIEPFRMSEPMRSAGLPPVCNVRVNVEREPSARVADLRCRPGRVDVRFGGEARERPSQTVESHAGAPIGPVRDRRQSIPLEPHVCPVNCSIEDSVPDRVTVAPPAVPSGEEVG